MKLTLFSIVIILLFFNGIVIAQTVSPTISGTVNISVKNGTMKCDFVLKDIPPIGNNYVIRINSGMNIHYFKNAENGNKLYYDTDDKDTLSSGESIAYFFHDGKNTGRFLPKELQVKYVGMYPIADSVNGYSVQDWRGNVAFNGYSVRADGLQSAWYPILFDTKKQQRFEKVRYDITINCDDCNTLFLNGSDPVKGTSAHFMSEMPQPLTMYCGRYDVANINGTYLLNPDMDVAQQKEFGHIINSFKNYYEKKLGIPYKENITFIQTTPTAVDYAFLFVSYPTILNVGGGKYGLHSFFDKKNGDYNKPYLAHELGHYYFGTYLRINTGFGDLINEGFAEFLSLKATKSLFPDSIYNSLINKKLKLLKTFTPTPIAFIKSKSDLKNRELYVYNNVPVILTAIEKEIGEKAMWQWMKNMLTTKTDFTDYTFFEKTFDAAVPDKAENENIKAKYFTTNDALNNAIKEIEVK